MAEPAPAPAPAARPVRWPIYVILGLIAAAGLARLVFLIGVFGGDEQPPSGVSEAKEGEEWSFKQLFDFLRNRGVPLAIYTTKERAPGGPVMSVCPEDYLAGQTLRLMHVQRRLTAAEAREIAAPQPEDAFAWGRFVLTGDKALLARVRAAFR